MICDMEERHAAVVAELHCRYLSGLLADLGKNVAKIFYEVASASEKGFGYVYMEDGRVLGFVFATVDHPGLYREVIRRGNVRLLSSAFFALLRNPRLIKEAISHLRSGHRPSSPELSYIAVEERERGRGIGGALIERLNEGFRRRDIHYYELSVDRDNRIARKFYEDRSFVLRYEFSECGLLRCRYYRKLEWVNISSKSDTVHRRGKGLS